MTYLAAALALAFTLQWSAPSTCMDGSPLNCPVSWRVLRLGPQSATWRADSAAILSEFRAGRSTTLARDIARIGAECAPTQIRSAAWLPGQQGATLSVTLPDSLRGVFLVLHTNSAGESPSWSNLVAKP